MNDEALEAICMKDYYDLKEKKLFHFEKYSKDNANAKDSDYDNLNEELDPDVEAGSEGRANNNGRKINGESDNVPNKKIHL